MSQRVHTHTAKLKLVVAWVDNTGMEATGRYRDRHLTHMEFRAVPEAKACCYSDDTPEMRRKLQDYIAAESKDHDWMGFFSMLNTSSILDLARTMALAQATARRKQA